MTEQKDVSVITVEEMAEQVDDIREEASFKNKPEPKEISEVADYKYREEAKQKMLKAGLYLPSRPSIPEDILDSSGNIALPADITAIDDEDLGRYLSIFTEIGRASCRERV